MILAAAIFTIMLKVVVLSAGGPAALTGLLEVAIGVLTVAAFVDAGRRSEGFGRQFWYLLSSAFVAWTLVHIVAVYERDVRGAAIAANYWPVIVLFFVFGLPFATVLLLQERQHGARQFRWRELLDFAQVGLLVLSVFLAFAFIPYLRDPSQRLILDRSLLWHGLRDVPLLLAFVARAQFSRSANVRYLFRRMSVYLALYLFGALFYFYVQAQWPNLTALTELMSDLVRVAAIALAVTSQEPAADSAERNAMTPSGMLWVQLVIFPAVILFMVPRIAAENLASAAVLVVFSIGCVCARLYLTQRAARRMEESLRHSELRFRKLAQGISEGSGQQLFQSLVVNAVEATGATYALIGEMKPGSKGTIRTVSFCKGRELLPPAEYELAGTPCENSYGKQLCHYASSVADLFPGDVMLKDIHAEAYIGSPLFRSDGTPLGIFAVLSEKPFEEPELAKSIVQICAARAARELERERHVEELRQVEGKLSLAFKLSPSPMLFGAWGNFDAIVNGQHEIGKLRMIAVSDSLVEFYGVPRETIIGRSPRELGVLVNADESRDLIRLVEEQKYFRDEELLITDGKGTTHMVLASGQLIETGGEQYLLATFHDVTFQRQTQKKLEESEQRYRTLFENAGDFIFTSELDGRYLTVNRVGRKICGLKSEEEVREHRFEELLDEESKTQLKLHLEQVIGNNQSDIFEVKLGKPGPVTHFEVSLQRMEEEGVADFVQGIARDITERKILEKKMAQSQRLEAVGTFSAGVAHDFNNLLTVIAGYTDLALLNTREGSEMRTELEEIRNATQRAGSLTNQLLMFSRKQFSQPRVFNLNDTVKNMLKLLQRILGEDVALDAHLDGGGAFVFADPVQFDQIIMNLAANARDAMRKGGKLTVSTSNLRLRTRDARLNLPEGDYAVLTVADTGLGMSDATLSRIFEPFFTTKEIGKGTGLGLATVYGAVQQANGQIAVASELGRGTTFTIYLPAARDAKKSAEESPLEVDKLGTETILVVEDDESLRQLAQKILDQAGYKVYCASGVEQAEHLLGEVGEQVHLLITDVVMPDGGGVELWSRISQRLPKLRVLFISGYTDGRLPEHQLIEGHSAFLAKPFKPTQLAGKVRELLDWKPEASGASAAGGSLHATGNLHSD